MDIICEDQGAHAQVSLQQHAQALSLGRTDRLWDQAHGQLIAVENTLEEHVVFIHLHHPLGWRVPEGHGLEPPGPAHELGHLWIVGCPNVILGLIHRRRDHPTQIRPLIIQKRTTLRKLDQVFYFLQDRRDHGLSGQCQRPMVFCPSRSLV